MTEAQKQRLERQLWNIANELRGKMDADEFRDYILGFIFYKYLSEKQHLFANKLLETEDTKDYALVTDAEDLDAIREESLEKLGYVLKPEELFSAVANIGTDAAAVLPKSMQIEFEKAADSGSGNTIFESLARWVDEQTSKAVLGQTMTSDSGSSRAQAEVHNEVRHDISAADARSVAGSIQRDLVIPYVDLNFGRQADYPYISIPVREPEDVKLIMDSTAALMAGGLRVKSSEVRSRLGFSDPDKNDEVIGGSAPAATPPKVVGEAANRMMPGDETSDPYAPLDEIEAHELRDWETIMDPILDPVLAIIDQAGSIKEAIERLPDALGEMDESKLNESLMRAMYIARARGDVSDE